MALAILIFSEGFGGALNKGQNNLCLLCTNFFFLISAGKNTAWIGLTTAHSWETLVIFGVNFKELNVHMNMGNVMGNVDWISKDFKSEGRLSIGSTGHKNMLISVGLSGSKLEAKAGTYLQLATWTVEFADYLLLPTHFLSHAV